MNDDSMKTVDYMNDHYHLKTLQMFPMVETTFGMGLPKTLDDWGAFDDNPNLKPSINQFGYMIKEQLRNKSNTMKYETVFLFF